MSYNIMNKRASFQGSNSGSIEDMVDIHTNQTITGRKTITDLTASTLLVSNDLTASGIVSASAFYGDGTGLSGVTVDPDGVNTQVQFNADGAFGASSNFVFNTGSSTLTVTGDITASANISASAFFGDGTGLTNVSTTVNAADLVGTLSASQIDHSSPLTNSAGNLTLKFAASNSGLTDNSGIKLDFGGLGATPYVDTYNIAAEDTLGNHFKITLATIGSNINTSATNINAGTLNNARLPSVISVSEVTASSGFSGDGSNLSNIAAGSTNQIQFHGFTTGDLAASSDLTFNDITDTLTTKIGSFEAVSASSYVSASSFAFADSIKIAGAPPGQDTVIDSNGNFYGDTINVGTVSGSNIVVTDEVGGVEYKLPNTDGANGQVMTTDGAGNLTFASVGGGSTVEDHWRTSTFFSYNQAVYYIPVNADPNARNQLDTISGLRWGGIHYNAPASGSLKRIRMLTTIGGATYTEPAKYDVIFCLAKNDTNASANDASTSPYGHITASANTYVVASGSIGLIWDIPITNNSEWSGSNTFDPGDILKMTNRYATAQALTQSYDASLTITFELSGSDV